MGGLKTYLASMALACVVSGAGAMPLEPREQVQAFASCAGRFSAQMEHAWLTGGTGETARARRGAFVSLLEAVYPAPDVGLSGAQVLDIRIRAKHAHLQLLHLAHFAQDTGRAHAAKARAEQLTAMCNALVLG